MLDFGNPIYGKIITLAQFPVGNCANVFFGRRSWKFDLLFYIAPC